MKDRTFEEMENDLSDQKMFDMMIQIKGLSLLSPEHGIYQEFGYLTSFNFDLFSFSSDAKTIHIQFSNFILKSSLDNDTKDDKALFQVDSLQIFLYVYSILIHFVD